MVAASPAKQQEQNTIQGLSGNLAKRSNAAASQHTDKKKQWDKYLITKMNNEKSTSCFENNL
ncbi:MAG: hypothetical protein JO327_09245 [Nitrososphaeraceae archaeon]|nr:hypothetical protein [Nitrososphaeraceae archaeon]